MTAAVIDPSVKVAGLSLDYEMALQSPFPSGISSNFVGHSFKKYAGAAEAYAWSHVGQRIAEKLSSLKAYPETNDTAFKFFGFYPNCVGHLINAACLQKFGEQNSLAASVTTYIDDVYRLMKKVYKRVDEQGYDQKTFQGLNYSFDLKEAIDVKGKQYAEAQPLNNSPQLQALLSVNMKLGIHKVNDKGLTSSYSLRAGLSQEKADEALRLVERSVRDSGYVDSDVKLQPIQGAMCNILEGKDIDKWILDHVKTHAFTDEQMVEIKGSHLPFEQAAGSVLLQEVLVRMNTCIEEDSFEVKTKALSMFLIQDHYPMSAGVKHELDAEAINAIRQKVCPGVDPISFARITYFRVEKEALNPLEGTDGMSMLEVVEHAKDVLKPNEFLDVAAAQLGRVVSEYKSTQAMQSKLAEMKV